MVNLLEYQMTWTQHFQEVYLSTFQKERNDIYSMFKIL